MPPAERTGGGGGGEPVMSAACACHGSTACLDLNMLGQCLLLKEEAMPIESPARSQPWYDRSTSPFGADLQDHDDETRERRQLSYGLILFCLQLPVVNPVEERNEQREDQ